MFGIAPLPIEATLPELKRALGRTNSIVLQAPPGAGKTTLVPLALLDQPWLGSQRIVMLEPRRIAARAAAHRMSALLREPLGEMVGYRVRSDVRVSARTRVEVVTEGVLTRLLHADPTLEGVGLVIFDEFHERSLHADVALALTLHAQHLVRPELRILVMSATLDGTRVARLLDGAPVIASEGRSFPVDVRYRPPRAGTKPTAVVAPTIAAALTEHSGDVLVFLPGAREIQDAELALGRVHLPAGTYVVPLHGALPLDEQDRAIAPSVAGTRKVVLATSIAETSLTIEGVRVVVDSGLARVPRFSPASGMSRLQTVRVTRAAAEQRCGRAGRVAPGVCLRLWHEHETAQLIPFQTPEILDADLAALALDLAIAGILDPLELRWLDPPPPAALAQARELLRELGALDERARISEHGLRIARLGAHPRLAHMMCSASDRGLGSLGADLAALLDERDIFRGRGDAPPVDIRLRLDALQHAGTRSDADAATLRRVREQADRWRHTLGVGRRHDDPARAGLLLALAYPDRIALRRAGPTARYALRGGGGALVPDHDPLGGERMLAVAETDGARPESRVRLAAPVTEADVRSAFADQIIIQDRVSWSSSTGEVRASRETRLGELALHDAHLSDPDPALVRDAIRSGLRQDGLAPLAWDAAAVHTRLRLAFAHEQDSSWPDVSDAALIGRLDDWLGPGLAEVRRGSDLSRIDLRQALLSLLDWRQRASLDELVPTHLEVPTGSRIAVDYSDATNPVLAVRLQEMFGCAETPRVFGGRVPVTLHLLSPAHRPVQVTRDLQGFWRSSYFDVRRDLRGRYPKHDWPDDPLAAQPTRRTKRRQ